MRVWQPFARAAHAVAWHEGGALVVAWDDAALTDALLDAGIDPQAVRVLPETALQEPLDEGVRLVESADGVEGQCWQRGMLRHSRWWPQQPEVGEWNNFLRGVPADVAVSMSDPSRLPPVQKRVDREAPWVRMHALEVPGEGAARWLSLAGIAGVAVLTAGTAVLAHRWVAVERQIEQARTEARALEAAVAPALVARERALSQMAELQALDARLTAPLPLEVLAHLGEVLPGRGVLLRDLDLGGGKLRLGLDVAETVSRSGLVRDVQAGGWLKDVAEIKDARFKGALVLEMSVDGARPVVTRVSTRSTPRNDGNASSALPGPSQPLPAPLPGASPSPSNESVRAEAPPPINAPRREGIRNEPPRTEGPRTDVPPSAPPGGGAAAGRDIVPGVGEARFPLPPAPAAAGSDRTGSR